MRNFIICFGLLFFIISPAKSQFQQSRDIKFSTDTIQYEVNDEDPFLADNAFIGAGFTLDMPLTYNLKFGTYGYYRHDNKFGLQFNASFGNVGPISKMLGDYTDEGTPGTTRPVGGFTGMYSFDLTGEYFLVKTTKKSEANIFLGTEPNDEGKDVNHYAINDVENGILFGVRAGLISMNTIVKATNRSQMKGVSQDDNSEREFNTDDLVGSPYSTTGRMTGMRLGVSLWQMYYYDYNFERFGRKQNQLAANMYIDAIIPFTAVLNDVEFYHDETVIGPGGMPESNYRREVFEIDEHTPKNNAGFVYGVTIQQKHSRISSAYKTEIGWMPLMSGSGFHFNLSYILGFSGNKSFF